MQNDPLEAMARAENERARGLVAGGLAERARVRAEREAAMARGPGVWSASEARERARRERAGLEPPFRPAEDYAEVRVRDAVFIRGAA